MNLKTIRSKISILLGIFVGLGAVNASAKGPNSFTNVYGFGDSFTYQPNSFAQDLAQKYGFSFVAGQNNFAGGYDSSGLAQAFFNYTTVNSQKVDPNALYTVYTGPNDIAIFSEVFGTTADVNTAVNLFGIYNYDTVALLNAFKAGTLNLAEVIPNSYSSIISNGNNIANFVQILSVNGANYILAPNTFNNTLREPFQLGDGELAYYLADQIKTAYNQSLYTNINALAPNANVIFIDYDRLVSEITSNPEAYFTADQIAGTYNDNGFFANAHPTTAAHAITNQYIQSILSSPTRVAMVKEVPIALGGVMAHNFQKSAVNLSANPMAVRSFDATLHGDYVNSRQKAQSTRDLGFKHANTENGEVNLNYQALENMLVGVRVHSNHTRLNFTNDFGRAHINEYGISLNTVITSEDNFFGYGSVGYGKLHYKIDRQIFLGTATRTQNGKTTGNHYMGLVGLGYRMPIDETFSVVPFADLNYQRVTMKSYTEKGDIQSTTMSFSSPARQSIVGELGVVLEGKFKLQENIQMLPSVTVGYGREFRDASKKKARGRVSDMPRDFYAPSYNSDRNIFFAQAALKSIINETISVGIDVGTRQGKYIKQWSIGASVGVQF